MTVLIDSWTWIEYWKGGKSAKEASTYIEGDEEAFISTVNLAEVYYWVLRYYDEGTADEKASTMLKRCSVIPVENETAIGAAKARKRHGLAFADSLVYATARGLGASLVTGDADLGGLDGTVILSR